MWSVYVWKFVLFLGVEAGALVFVEVGLGLGVGVGVGWFFVDLFTLLSGFLFGSIEVFLF